MTIQRDTLTYEDCMEKLAYTLGKIAAASSAQNELDRLLRSERDAFVQRAIPGSLLGGGLGVLAGTGAQSLAQYLTPWYKQPFLNTKHYPMAGGLIGAALGATPAAVGSMKHNEKLYKAMQKVLRER